MPDIDTFFKLLYSCKISFTYLRGSCEQKNGTSKVGEQKYELQCDLKYCENVRAYYKLQPEIKKKNHIII